MRAVCDRLIALFFALGWLATLASGAHAGPYGDAIAHFASDSYDETADAINGITASGNPLAATVIGALRDGQLQFSAGSKRVFFKDKSDRLIDAATGQPLAGAPPADLAPVRVNNRLRRVIDAALG